jgi:hypothetical protein
MLCGSNRERMMGEAGPWRDVRRHLPGEEKLAWGSCSEQRDHKIFQRDNPGSEFCPFGVDHLDPIAPRVVSRDRSTRRANLRIGEINAPVVVPSCERPLAQLNVVRIVGMVLRHRRKDSTCSARCLARYRRRDFKDNQTRPGATTLGPSWPPSVLGLDAVILCSQLWVERAVPGR